MNTGTTSALNHGTNVVLTAAATTGSTVAWTTCTGAASGNGTAQATCTYASLDGNKTAAAAFTLNTYTVTATAQGNGAGTVQSNVGGVSYSYPAVNTGTTSALNHGTNVVLTATASPGSTVAWTTCTGTPLGNGTGQATCTYASLDGNKTAAATFTLNTYSLTVIPSGTGSGSLTGNGIDCSWDENGSSGTCSINLNYNVAVSLTAAPSTGSAFSGWSGGSGSASGCSGTGACAFEITQASSIGSIFIQKSSIYLPLILRP